MTRSLRPALLLFSTVCLALGPAAPAAAHGWTAPGDWYVELGGGHEWVELPELGGAYSAYGYPGTTDNEIGRWFGEAAIGYADPDGLSLPDPIGRNARVEARLRYARGVSDSDSFALGFLSFVNTWTNTELESWDFDLTYQTDLVLAGPVTLAPFVGFWYSRMQYDNDYKSAQRTIIGNLFVESNDHTGTDYYGGSFGADLVVRPVEWLAFTLGVRGDLAAAVTDMDADTDFVLVSIVSATIEQFDRDSETNFAARTTATFGIEASAGPLTLGVEAFARWISRVSFADYELGSVGGFGVPVAEIASDDAWSAGVRGSLTIWFP